MKLAIIFSLLIILKCYSSFAGDEPEIVARITVQAGGHQRFDTPVSVRLDDITPIHESSLRLYEVSGENINPVPVQFSSVDGRKMHWLLSGNTATDGTRTYDLVKGLTGQSAAKMKVERGSGYYTLFSENNEVLRYNAAEAHVPEDVNQIYRRSGFIHPLFSPDGTVLTSIQPPDHYHHYGLWNPWTRTTFRGEEVDFWNLAKGEGRVRYGGTAAVNEGDVFSGIRVLHEHVAWPGSTRETIALNELQDIKVYNRNDGSFLVEIFSSVNPAEKITLEEYRYGGFVFRGTEEWTNQTSGFFTSRGLDRDQADGERAEWCVVYGESNSGSTSMLMMGAPSNYNHPEPLRVWPSNANRGRGDVFINFSPTRNTQWELEPGNDYLLVYRLIIFDGEVDKEKAAILWDDFANPPVINIEKYSTYEGRGKWDNRTGEIEGSRILMFTRVGDGGFYHKSIPASVEAMKDLAEKNNFIIDVTDDPSVFNDENLKGYHALVFANTNNDVFDDDRQREALKRYVRSGGGFVGIHIAIGTERGWDWYKQMTGATFDRHPPYQEFNVNIRDKTHPSSRHLPDPWTIIDEPYFVKEYNPDVRVIMTHDMSTIEDRREKPEIFGNYYPSVWCSTFDGGRQWITSYGHDDHIFKDEMFMQHILGGIKWVIADGLPVYR